MDAAQEQQQHGQTNPCCVCLFVFTGLVGRVVGLDPAFRTAGMLAVGCLSAIFRCPMPAQKHSHVLGLCCWAASPPVPCKLLAGAWQHKCLSDWGCSWLLCGWSLLVLYLVLAAACCMLVLRSGIISTGGCQVAWVQLPSRQAAGCSRHSTPTAAQQRQCSW